MARLRLGLIGAGRWGKVYIRTLAGLAQRCELAVVCSRNPLAPQFVPGGARLVTDWSHVIESDCDGVIVAMPPSLHPAILRGCLARRKPCLIEKPLCLDAETADQLHREVLSIGVPVLVNHTQLFNPAYRTLKQAVQSRGATIRALVADDGALGPFRERFSALWDRGPHAMSLMLDLLAQSPQHVEALQAGRGPAHETELAGVRLTFEGGVEGWIHVGTLLSPKRRRLMVFTDGELFCFDDLAADRVTVAPIVWSRRYEGGLPEAPAWAPIPVEDARLPMTVVLETFLDGLSGGSREAFGTALAREIVRALAACETGRNEPTHVHERLS